MTTVNQQTLTFYLSSNQSYEPRIQQTLSNELCAIKSKWKNKLYGNRQFVNDHFNKLHYILNNTNFNVNNIGINYKSDASTLLSHLVFQDDVVRYIWTNCVGGKIVQQYQSSGRSQRKQIGGFILQKNTKIGDVVITKKIICDGFKVAFKSYSFCLTSSVLLFFFFFFVSIKLEK